MSTSTDPGSNPGGPHEVPGAGLRARGRHSDHAHGTAFRVLRGFLVAAVVCSVVDSFSGAVAVCWTGTALGALGFGLFALQRRAARRGRRTAQKGLVHPPEV